MIRWRVCNIIKRFARNSDDVLLAEFERVRGFNAEWKVLRRPSENGLANLAPLWANGNLRADRSDIVSGRILKCISVLATTPCRGLSLSL